jgi:hypothetical protein
MITITHLEDHEDGSCTVSFDMNDQELIEFAKIGLLKVLKDTAEQTIATKKPEPVPCNTSNPNVRCDGCDCWKTAREYSS